MVSFITCAAVGAVLCFLGVKNMRGDISSLHHYHRQRVTEENVKPFGRLVGLGTLIIGVAIIIFGALSFACEMTEFGPLLIIGNVELIVGLILGLTISFYAMIKYNKGIF